MAWLDATELNDEFRRLKEGQVLLLSRHVGQEIVIDGEIRVIVTSVEGQRVRLGITAPAHVRIRRREVTVPTGEHCPLEPVAPAGLLTDDKNSGSLINQQ